ncbi:hypothetical protein Q7P37_008741 [Cladosporium fusiforme]
MSRVPQAQGYAHEVGVLQFMDQSKTTADRANLRYLKTTTFEGNEDHFKSSILALNASVSTPGSSSVPQSGPSWYQPEHLGMPPAINSATANREQIYEAFISIFNPKNIGPRSQGIDFMRMLALLAPSHNVLRDSFDALSLMQVGSTHCNGHLIGESIVRYGKALRGTRQALNSASVTEDGLLATVSVLAICEFFDHMKQTPSAWLGHLTGLDHILLARGPDSVRSKLSMLLFYQSRVPALSRSLLRRKSDPLSSPEWRAVLQRIPLGPAGSCMELALQVPELLERYDCLNVEGATASPDVEQLLSDCERVENRYRQWYADLQETAGARVTGFYKTTDVENFPTYASLVLDRTLQGAYQFTDQKFAFLHQQYWCCMYFLRETIFHLREYQQQWSKSSSLNEQRSKEINATADKELDDYVFSLCRCIPGFSEPITGAHGHTAIFLPLCVATMHFRSRRLSSWANWAEIKFLHHPGSPTPSILAPDLKSNRREIYHSDKHSKGDRHVPGAIVIDPGLDGECDCSANSVPHNIDELNHLGFERWLRHMLKNFTADIDSDEWNDNTDAVGEPATVFDNLFIHGIELDSHEAGSTRYSILKDVYL